MRAVNPGVLFDRPSLSFGNLKPTPGETTQVSAVVQARNITGEALTYTLGTRQTDGPAFTVSVNPATITVGPQEVATFQVTVSIPPGQGPVDYGAVVELTGGVQNLHIPVWVRTLPAAQSTKVLLLDNDGSTSLGLPTIRATMPMRCLNWVFLQPTATWMRWQANHRRCQHWASCSSTRLSSGLAATTTYRAGHCPCPRR
ncbi:MAG: hypothetical protein HC893_00145 [Chloroflexaceae bacterium]|nr:hypothetical protein [Chloroflexaceae bacterium]